MHRYGFVVLFVLVLITPFVMRLVVRGSDDLPKASADAIRLVIVTPHNQDIRREFAFAFDAWHREKYGRSVAIDYRNVGGTNDIKRMLDATYKPFLVDGKLPADAKVNPDVHMVWGGGEFMFDVEIKHLFQPVTLDRAILIDAIPSNDLGGRPLYDRGEQIKWVGPCISGFGIAYSPPLFDALGMSSPTTWADLTDPRLQGMLALADPSSSGSAAVAYVMVLQRAMADAEAELLARDPNVDRKGAAYTQAIERGFTEGMRQLTLIAANSRYFTDSASQVLNDIGKADAAAGTSIDFYGRTYEAIVGRERIRYVTPVGASALNADPIAILFGVTGDAELAANRFIEFLLTRQGQLLWIKEAGTPGGPRDRTLFRSPVRRDVYADKTNWVADVDPWAEASGFNQRDEWMRTFSQIRELWAAAWIDNRETLKDTYARLLTIDDPEKRRAAIDELARLPVTFADTHDIRARGRAAPDSDRFKAAERLTWAKKFRAHFRSVADKYGV
jgi:ABC-type Fe3+ transport system substrate-binding protein